MKKTKYYDGGDLLKDVGAGSYGVAEGLVDNLSFGLTDSITDKGFTALNNLGKSNAKDIARQNIVRSSGNIAGNIGGAVLTGGATTKPAITNSIGSASDIVQQTTLDPRIKKAVNVASQLAPLALGDMKTQSFGENLLPQGIQELSNAAGSMTNPATNMLLNAYSHGGKLDYQTLEAIGVTKRQANKAYKDFLTKYESGGSLMPYNPEHLEKESENLVQYDGPDHPQGGIKTPSGEFNLQETVLKAGKLSDTPYAFSDINKLDKATAAQLGLDTKHVGKTMAEISKSIEKKYEVKFNDDDTKAKTKQLMSQDLYSRLMEANETMLLKAKAKQMWDSQPNYGAMSQEEFNDYMCGGKVKEYQGGSWVNDLEAEIDALPAATLEMQERNALRGRRENTIANDSQLFAKGPDNPNLEVSTRVYPSDEKSRFNLGYVDPEDLPAVEKFNSIYDNPYQHFYDVFDEARQKRHTKKASGEYVDDFLLTDQYVQDRAERSEKRWRKDNADNLLIMAGNYPTLDKNQTVIQPPIVNTPRQVQPIAQPIQNVTTQTPNQPVNIAPAVTQQPVINKTYNGPRDYGTPSGIALNNPPVGKKKLNIDVMTDMLPAKIAPKRNDPSLLNVAAPTPTRSALEPSTYRETLDLYRDLEAEIDAMPNNKKKGRNLYPNPDPTRHLYQDYDGEKSTVFKLGEYDNSQSVNTNLLLESSRRQGQQYIDSYDKSDVIPQETPVGNRTFNNQIKVDPALTQLNFGQATPTPKSGINIQMPQETMGRKSVDQLRREALSNLNFNTNTYNQSAQGPTVSNLPQTTKRQPIPIVNNGSPSTIANLKLPTQLDVEDPEYVETGTTPQDLAAFTKERKSVWDEYNRRNGKIQPMGDQRTTINPPTIPDIGSQRIPVDMNKGVKSSFTLPESLTSMSNQEKIGLGLKGLAQLGEVASTLGKKQDVAVQRNPYASQVSQLMRDRYVDMTPIQDQIAASARAAYENLAGTNSQVVNAALGQGISNQQMAQMSQAKLQAQQLNNGYKGELANTLNNLGQQDVAAKNYQENLQALTDANVNNVRREALGNIGNDLGNYFIAKDVVKAKTAEERAFMVQKVKLENMKIQNPSQRKENLASMNELIVRLGGTPIEAKEVGL